MRLLVFGDSIAHGYWDMSGGWVQRIRSIYDAQGLKNLNKEDVAVYNLGVSGDTAASIVPRVANEIQARRWIDEEVITIIAVGINDASFKDEQHAESTPELYTGELEQITSAARQFGKKMLFVGLTPVDQKLTQPVSWNDNVNYSNQRNALFERALLEFCDKNSLPCVAVLDLFSERMKLEQLLADGLHPNEAGHQFLVSLIKPEIDKLLV